MTDTEAKPKVIGGDAAHGRFEYFHKDCGTIYADNQEKAVAYAFTRLHAHDSTNAAQSAIHVQLVGVNQTPKDWKPE